MQKLKADKKLLVASNMELTDAESKAFWPLYDAYQKDLRKVNERLGKVISEYADAYNQGKGTISNDLAKKLIHEAISAEEEEVKNEARHCRQGRQSAAGRQNGAVYPDRKQNPCGHQDGTRETDSVGVLADGPTWRGRRNKATPPAQAGRSFRIQGGNHEAANRAFLARLALQAARPVSAGGLVQHPAIIQLASEENSIR